MVGRELRSLGVPTINDRIATQADPRVTIYSFCVDQGGDERGMLRRLKEKLSPCPNVWLYGTFCLQHICQIIGKDTLKILDAFQWWHHIPDATRQIFDGHYFASLSSVANLWRSAGAATRIRRSADIICTSSLEAQQKFGKIPGKCLRGRWTCAQSVQEIITKAGSRLTDVFSDAYPQFLGATGDDDASAVQSGPSHHDAPDATSKWRKYKRGAIHVATSPLFRCTATIACLCMRTVVKCQAWMMARVKETQHTYANCGRGWIGLRQSPMMFLPY